MATANQLEKICRNGNKKKIWQLKRAEIVLLLYLFGNWQPTTTIFITIECFWGLGHLK
jgi:hypothetical protein